ncbi:GNAT family N-acetyltransferase [Streptomyces sp. H10-C2]|uniref:GNAT family N-acetyltransferase n=1 Tax=unclassified Streptomyces TaxID=2593676 RepID=UPI0024B8D7F9|nr:MULTISPECIES: GNAT family N-acetyltransferase [unclassified Streptomyces]MDJ0343429.1 GNAT family N-acetyltransferase [Streptomyces sp. PH10-H1]MDJ0371509.1 GNAT family N-acetyltransferase [Streptomyces sp. H10-C2]
MSFPEAATPPELRAQVVALQDEAWPDRDAPALPRTSLTHDPELNPVTMVLVDGDIDGEDGGGADGGTVLAALDILSKEIRHAGRLFAVGGLSTVVTRRAARGRGHGRLLVTAAHETMARQGLDLGLFTCDRPLRAFYESAGWHALPGAVIVGGTRAAAFPSDQPGFDKVTMADFFTTEGRRHASSFHHARLGLYPGGTDRLW